MLIAPIIGLECFFLVMAFATRLYLIPDLLSTMIGLLLINALVSDQVITYYASTTLVSYPLPTFFFLPMVLLTIFPMIHIIMRFKGG